VENGVKDSYDAYFLQSMDHDISSLIIEFAMLG